MAAVVSSEIVVNFYHTNWHHMAEDCNVSFSAIVVTVTDKKFNRDFSALSFSSYKSGHYMYCTCGGIIRYS